MPSSPELVELPRWEAAELRSAAAVAPVPAPVPAPVSAPVSAPVPPRIARPMFEPAFAAVPAARTETFVVSPTAAVPEAVLADARRAARSAGYADGYANGATEARRRGEEAAEAERQRTERAVALIRAESERALQAVVQAAHDVAGRTATTLADVEHHVLDTAFAIAEQLVGRTLADDPQRGRTALARAFALVPEGHDEVCVALNPDDHAALLAVGTAVPENVRVVADPSLAPGDAVATADATTVDARIGAALERVREVLGR